MYRYIQTSVFIVILIIVFLVSPFSVVAACRNIMMYGAGNTPQWESDLGLKNVRAACSNTPTYCLNKRLNPTTGTLRYYEKLFLGISGDPETAADYALQYSKLSKTYTKLYEIGFDDFYAFWKNDLQFNNTKLKEIIDNTKKINTNLKFGITLYENELPLLTTITSANRNKVNYVHLYLHHRKTNIEADVQQVKTLFPNAKIIAGSYAFDFKSPCTTTSIDACDGALELSYFKDSLKRQKALMDTCVIEAIEFWPAFFGKEENISFDACYAKGKTKNQCIVETKEMRKAALTILNGTSTPTPTKRPTPTMTKKATPTSTKKATPTPIATKIPTATPTMVLSTPTETLNPTATTKPTLHPTNILKEDFSVVVSVSPTKSTTVNTSVKNIVSNIKTVVFQSSEQKPSLTPEPTQLGTDITRSTPTVAKLPNQTVVESKEINKNIDLVLVSKKYVAKVKNFFLYTIDLIKMVIFDKEQ